MAMEKSTYSKLLISFSVLFFLGASGHAQTLVVLDDSYGVPLGLPLQVETFGVLDNDTLDDQPVGENGVTAELVNDVSHGMLVLNTDGSFSYTPDSSFNGSDTFIYRAVFNSVISEATVILTACEGGPQLFSCWKEASYLDKVGELGYGTFQEGFENDTTWGSVREPDTAVSVTSRGIQWQANHPDPPANNEITTGTGPARTGLWGIYDPAHGYATGTPQECDIDDPPEHCLYYDGFTGIRQAGQSSLHGVGGFITGFTGANVALILDGDVNNQIDLGKLPGPGHQFFGVIDDSATGFTEFEFRELDGKVGQLNLIFGDDFTFATFCIDAKDCEDELFCNGTDTCSDGTCFHSGNPCLPDLFCNEETDSCEQEPVTTTTTSPTDTSTTTTTTVRRCPCLIEQIYSENAEEVAFLRKFRDEVLSKTPSGQELISLYYRISPMLVELLEGNEVLRDTIIRLYYNWGPPIIEAMKEDEEFSKEVMEIIGLLLPLTADQVE
jgi:hypothetical protein